MRLSERLCLTTADVLPIDEPPRVVRAIYRDRLKVVVSLQVAILSLVGAILAIDWLYRELGGGGLLIVFTVLGGTIGILLSASHVRRRGSEISRLVSQSDRIALLRSPSSLRSVRVPSDVYGSLDAPVDRSEESTELSQSDRIVARVLKRTIDLIVSASLLVLMAPVMVVVAMAIKVTDRGPIVFRQARIGRGGKPFYIFKFRTMAVDAEARLAALRAVNERGGPLFKLESDPRITRVGEVLRRTALDELPQLVNVLRGDMSLVGPRAALPAEVEVFDEELFRSRTRVKPGITGLWQVNARDDCSFETYRRIDLEYARHWSIPLDLAILSKTFVDALTGLFRCVVPERSGRLRGILSRSAVTASVAVQRAASLPDVAHVEERRVVDSALRLRPAILNNSQTTASVAVELVVWSGEVEEGVGLLRAALQQKIDSNAGTLDVAATRANLALALAHRGDFDEAKILLAEALHQEERVRGPRHPEVARTLLDLAYVVRSKGDFKAAAYLGERARSILEPFGVSHPDDLLERVRQRL